MSNRDMGVEEEVARERAGGEEHIRQREWNVQKPRGERE